ncbi:hypothetical protein AHF37_03291 [Paragonimus kellicotti]|nr:hypothetical protein AHF37_03291 [Paragonimus kellicotti]
MSSSGGQQDIYENAICVSCRKLDLIPIVDQFEAVYEYITNDGPVLTIRTNLDAPMYKLINIDLSNPNRSCLSVHHLQTGEKMCDLDLPLGSVCGVTGRKRDTMAFVRFASFLTPGQIFSCDLTQKPLKLTLFRESLLNGIDLSSFTVKQVFYESRDKTRIPMFIVCPQSLVLDGSRPCQLYGYGGFDIAITPSFSINQLLLLLHFGGIVAVANIRGGGEYGKPWHDAGRRANKQNCFDDFQAAAEYLIDNGYTCRDKLYISGGSNGGLLVCACANQRPDLFGAVIAHVPVCDLLRFHRFTIGHAWISDYGNPENEEDFKVLIRYSPLHNIKPPADPKVQYPALLILTADHDDRVVPLHSFKFISTLQATVGGPNQTKPLLARIETKAGHGAGKLPLNCYSPLHNIKPPADPKVQYPALLILTADHDDRVVPLHSFKFISTLQATVGGPNQTKPLLARIETKAGHGAGKPTSKLVS